MKKVLGIMLLVALLATPAFAASIKNSKHNLSTSGPGSIKSTDYDEICVFCHTPHAANKSVALAPLWNRGVITGSTLDPLYNSSTLEAANRPSQVDVDSTDAPLCLSCHDGSSLAGQLVNPSNLAGGGQPSFAAGKDKVSSTANLLDSSNGLSNDHPIGFDYTDAIVTSDGELQSYATVTGAGLNFYENSRAFWCSTCHDVHNDANNPFLAKSNSASGLCLTCHIK